METNKCTYYTQQNIHLLKQFIEEILFGKSIRAGKSYPVLSAEGGKLKVEIVTEVFFGQLVNQEFNVFVGKNPSDLVRGNNSILLEDWSIVIAFLKLLEDACVNQTIVSDPLDANGRNLLAVTDDLVCNSEDIVKKPSDIDGIDGEDWLMIAMFLAVFVALVWFFC